MSDADGAAVGGAGLEPAEWRLAGRQRALVYGWLSTLYAAEVPARTLGAYLDGEAAPLFGGLAALGLEAEVSRLQAALAVLAATSDAALELAADFAQLFLLDARAGAPPYASAYEGDSADAPLFGSSPARMQAFLADSALAVRDCFREPADHLAIHLALMTRLIEQHAEASAERLAAAARDEVAFLRAALLGWLPRFADRCQRTPVRLDFYPALAALLLAFVRADALFLDDAAAGG